MGSLLHHHFKMTPHRMMRKLKMITGITRDFICRHHVEPRVKLYMPKEESFFIPFKYIDVTRTTHTSLDVLLEKHNDYWNVDRERKISDAWTGFTRFILLNERPPDGYTVSGKRLMRKQTTSRPVNVWPDMWKHMSDAVNKKAKQRWPIKRTKLDNARQSRGIFFTEPDDEEIQNSMKNAGRKLEIPIPAAMPCKTPTNCRGETCRNIGKKQDQICLYWRCRRIYEKKIEGVPHRCHRRSHLCKRNKFTESL